VSSCRATRCTPPRPLPSPPRPARISEEFNQLLSTSARGQQVEGVLARQIERLRELASWYREYAERTGNPAIWDARIRTAEDLEAEAARLEGLPQLAQVEA
jgi:hypothetical protein